MQSPRVNQTQYSDNGGGNSRVNNGGSRRSVHSTGRSNYSGSGSGSSGGGGRSRRGLGNSAASGDNNGQQQQGNPIANWIQNSRRRRSQQQKQGAPAVVGTEANAIKQMARNAKNFKYPPEGFVTPVEHSLLYAMVQYPERYPESVVKGEIVEEEFEQYLYVKDEASGSRRRRGEDDDRRRNREGEEGSDHAAAASSHPSNDDDDDDDDERRVSYAQLSALLALSAEKNPSTATPDGQQPSSTSSSSSGSSNNNKDEQQVSIGQALCRKLLRTITRYCDSRSLDRKTEIAEFLQPVERRCQVRNEKAALRTLLPAYAGYTVSLLTGNPIPLLIGVAALSVEDKMVEETANVSNFSSAGSRRAQIETAGLLDECDSD